jgi:cell division protein ZipA
VAAELRWILLGLSLPLLAGIWWWTARRAGQTPGNSELRESTPSVDPPRYADSGDDSPPEPAPQPRDWGVPPFEPLNIHTADFDHIPVLDGPMMVGAEPAAVPGSVDASAPAPAPVRPPTPPPSVRPMFTTGPVSEHSDRAAATAPPAPNAAELQRIVTIRVCAVGETRWPGSQLMAALELHGLAFGRYQVFHRKHTDGRSLFCVASLIEPGTFDVAEMADQEYRGVTLFAVLPGPMQPIETMDELLGTARGLAEELSGMVQDSKGMPLSPQRAAALREDIARFQASLPGN